MAPRPFVLLLLVLSPCFAIRREQLTEETNITKPINSKAKKLGGENTETFKMTNPITSGDQSFDKDGSTQDW